jgi:Na+/phosphate symporter
MTLVFPLVLAISGGTIPPITAMLGAAPAAQRVAYGNAFFGW